jgi:hypothetical protein
VIAASTAAQLLIESEKLRAERRGAGVGRRDRGKELQSRDNNLDASSVMTDFQILRNEIQIFRNEIQARRNKFQIRRNEIQIQNSSLPFLELSLFNDLRGPSTRGARPQMGRPSCEPGVSPGHPGHARDFRRRGPTQGVRRIRQSFVLSIVASDCCDMTARMAGTSPDLRPSVALSSFFVRFRFLRPL